MRAEPSTREKVFGPRSLNHWFIISQRKWRNIQSSCDTQTAYAKSCKESSIFGPYR
jgi:hypothetical protein